MKLLSKGAIEPLSQAQSEGGLYSRYFLVHKKDGGLRPILDLRQLNKALMKRQFRMLTTRKILSHVPAVWLVPGTPSIYELHGALVLLKLRGIRVLNHLDDWLILAQSHSEIMEHRAVTGSPRESRSHGKLGKEFAIPQTDYIFSGNRTEIL